MSFNPQTTNRQELTGIFEAVRVLKEDSRWMVGHLKSGEVVTGVLGDRDLIPGVEYRFLGKWDGQENVGFGKQFKFETFLQSEPHTRHGVVAYLKNVAPCVGDVTAHKLCDLYGENDCIRVLKRNPERVAGDIVSLRGGKAQEAARVLIEQEKFQETRIDLLDLFAGRGFPGTLIDNCISTWGILAAVRVKKDPFCLLSSDMPGCGWLRVDRLYGELGNEPDRITRKVICAWHAVREDRSGSVWVKWDEVVSAMQKLITNCPNVETAIEISIAAGWLAKECVEGDVFLAEREQAEYEGVIAERLAVLA